MRTRNTIVSEALKRQYNHRVPGATLKVFCVSNQDYRDHRWVPREAALPYLNLSGIIEFRQFCVSIVSESQHRAAQLYMKDRIPGLLGQIDLWVQTSLGGGASVLRPAIRQALDTLESRLESVCSLFSLLATASSSLILIMPELIGLESTRTCDQSDRKRPGQQLQPVHICR